MQKAIEAKMAMGMICWRDETSKKCIVCQEIKPLDQFFKKGKTRTSACNKCSAARTYQKYKQKLSRLREEIFKAYGAFCSCCGETERRFLSLDHIGGGGKEHRIRAKGTQTKMYSDVIREGAPKDKYRILCMNCNWAMRYNEPCPHTLNAMKQKAG